jgi:hypothetical protein
LIPRTQIQCEIAPLSSRIYSGTMHNLESTLSNKISTQ